MSGFKQVSTTNAVYTNGQYGASVQGEQRTPEMMDMLRMVGKMCPDRKVHESLYSDGFIISKREKIDGKCN